LPETTPLRWGNGLETPLGPPTGGVFYCLKFCKHKKKEYTSFCDCRSIHGNQKNRKGFSMTSQHNAVKPKTLREVVNASKAAQAKEKRGERATEIFNIIEKYHPEVTRYALAAAVGKKWDTVNNWIQGTKVPNATSLKRLEAFYAQITKGGLREKKTAASKPKAKAR